MRERDEYTAYWARWKFAKLAVPLRERARALGYNLLVHGSLARDIDLVAVPWIEGASSLDELVVAFAQVVRELNDSLIYGYDADGNETDDPARWRRTAKPHGRVAVSIHVGGVASPDIMAREGTYLDLSILPLVTKLPAGGPDAA
jgi:hypothetical protein